MCACVYTHDLREDKVVQEMDGWLCLYFSFFLQLFLHIYALFFLGGGEWAEGATLNLYFTFLEN